MRSVKEYVEEGRKNCSSQRHLCLPEYNELIETAYKERGSFGLATDAFYFGVAVGMKQMKDENKKLNIIGNNIREARGSRSIDEVCKAVGITDTALMAYESGERMPRDSVKMKLAKYYQKRISDLFFV